MKGAPKIKQKQSFKKVKKVTFTVFSYGKVCNLVHKKNKSKSPCYNVQSLLKNDEKIINTNGQKNSSNTSLKWPRPNSFVSPTVSTSLNHSQICRHPPIWRHVRSCSCHVQLKIYANVGFAWPDALMLL